MRRTHMVYRALSCATISPLGRKRVSAYGTRTGTRIPLNVVVFGYIFPVRSEAGPCCIALKRGRCAPLTAQTRARLPRQEGDGFILYAWLCSYHGNHTTATTTTASTTTILPPWRRAKQFNYNVASEVNPLFEDGLPRRWLECTFRFQRQLAQITLAR